MAEYDSRPLYRDSIKLAAMVEKLVGKSTRQYRFTIGQRMMDKAMRLPVDFYRAYDEKDERIRLSRIHSLKTHFVEIKMCIDVAHELKLFSQSDFAALLDCLGIVDRQVEGWLKNTHARVSAIKGDG